MGLLTGRIEDLAPRGRLLPEGEYLATIEEAKLEALEKGTQLMRRYGNIRTPDGLTDLLLADGSTFQIGNRKLFVRSWTDHVNPEATRAGNGAIIREAVATGLMDAPTAAEPSELAFESWADYAEALVGKEVRVRVRHRTHDGKDVDPETGKKVRVTDAEVVDWLVL